MMPSVSARARCRPTALTASRATSTNRRLAGSRAARPSARSHPREAAARSRHRAHPGERLASRRLRGQPVDTASLPRRTRGENRRARRSRRSRRAQQQATVSIALGHSRSLRPLRRPGGQRNDPTRARTPARDRRESETGVRGIYCTRAHRSATSRSPPWCAAAVVWHRGDDREPRSAMRHWRMGSVRVPGDENVRSACGAKRGIRCQRGGGGGGGGGGGVRLSAQHTFGYAEAIELNRRCKCEV